MSTRSLSNPRFKVLHTAILVPFLVFGSGCAMISENGNTALLSSTLGVAGGVAGYAVGREQGAAAGAIVGSSVGAFVGGKFDKMAKDKADAKNNVDCPYCGEKTNIKGAGIGDTIHCQHCGHPFALRATTKQ